MNLTSATGVGNIPVGNPMSQNMKQFEQIQNSMPLKSDMLRQTSSKLGSGKAVGARTRTVMMAGPTISGSSPNFDLNENHMDSEMMDTDINKSMAALP